MKRGPRKNNKILYRCHDGKARPRLCVWRGLFDVGDRTSIQRLALKHDNAVLVTGGLKWVRMWSIYNQGTNSSHPNHTIYTVATMISGALSNMQIKTDILAWTGLSALPWVRLSFWDGYGPILFLDLVRKNRFSRFPGCQLQHQMVRASWITRDAGDKAPQTTLYMDVTGPFFTTNLSTSIATIKANGWSLKIMKWFLLFVITASCCVITRRDAVMDRISKVQFSSLPTFSGQIWLSDTKQRTTITTQQ